MSQVILDTDKVWDIGKASEATQKRIIELSEGLQSQIKGLSHIEDFIQLYDERIERQIRRMKNEANRCGMAASYIFKIAENYERTDRGLAKGLSIFASVLDKARTENDEAFKKVSTETYYIKKGDTLTAIANKYNTSVDELCRLNDISNPNLIYAGATLLIPISNQSYNGINKDYSVPQKAQEKNKSIGGTTSNVSYDGISSSLSVPYYNQLDNNWKNVKIGTKSIGDIGCLTTCLSMTESFYTQTDITPDKMVKKLRFKNNDLYWNSAEDLGYKFTIFPNGTKGVSESYCRQIYESLKNGNPVIIGGTDGGKGQHWVVITGYKGDGSSFNPSDFVINDPGKKSRVVLSDYLSYMPYPSRLVFKG